MKRIINVLIAAFVLSMIPTVQAVAQTNNEQGHIESLSERRARQAREAEAKKKKEQQEAAAKKKREEEARKKREAEAAAQRQREEEARKKREQEEAERKRRQQSQEAQQTSSTDDTVYDAADQMPSFPGGTSELYRWLSQTVKYPVAAEAAGIQGRVIVSFIVEKDGTLSNISVIKSVDIFLDNEALRVVNSMPKWEPGRQNGQIVRVKITMPIKFKLASNNPK